MIMRRRLACCTRDMREVSIDFDEQERIMTYNGLESCILNGHSFDNESGTSRGEGCVTDSFDEDDSSCSSSTNAFGSFSSLWTIMKKDDQCQDEWNSPATPRRYNEAYWWVFSFCFLVSSGSWRRCQRNARSSGKEKWIGCSPTNHMVELVPAKQNGTNGRTLEIMTPKARADVHMNLPALRKLDSMLIETLDSMVDTEFWYAEVGSRAEGRSRSAGQSKRWWLPSPRVPPVGLSDIERKRLLHQGKLIYQVFKAAKSINENVLVEMPIPVPIKDALPKSGKASLGEELYKILTGESMSAEDMSTCLNLKSEHSALEAINRLEAAVFAWKEKITEQNNGKSPVRTSWSFMKDPLSELDKTESLVYQAEVLLQQLKNKYPNLPQTFLDVTKIQYGKDVGHAILEAYSRVLANLAFSILSRIGDILQEDLNSADGKSFNASDIEAHYEEAKISSVSATPSRSRVWCIGREACHSVSAQNSP
ncbi:Rop guanine nucleotide exchange factor 14 [Sesamum angolense]|uniref:Rop guanine nucleotide exchange factor 14 n=1 Tax=Sesamum angolense TaxID=2727404 RepID=A0AAE2BKV3_9LAMI|nr:Rop guanine nucleotide exchange factor 14 [Sesamum angolense]